MKADKRMKLLLENFIKHQETETKNLQSRLEAGREEILRGRDEDYKRIFAKFKVLKENMEDTHTLEKQKVQKNLKSFRPNSKFFSRSVQEQLYNNGHQEEIEEQ